ncbi:MAG: DNA polymerase I, partial [Candidatus Melainabacteria bacterium]|nr:DNA polymerase I [Candidatus Melainabacteria bacterium]
LSMVDKSQKLHAEFNQGVTSTGRLSSSNPNLQNIPVRTDDGKELRKCFISSFENGYVLAADYSQIELRILAHLSQDPVLINAFKHNHDIHKATASSVFNIPIDQVTDKQRYMCKTLNFALLYQQGPNATAEQLGIAVEEAEKFTASYFSKLTGVLMFIDKIKFLTRKVGYTETLFGRRRYYYNLKSSHGGRKQADLRAAVNMPIQGTSADITKLAIVQVEKFLKDYKSKILFTVHDELVIDVHPDELDIIRTKVKDIMEFNQPLSVPIIVNVKYGKSWYDCK